MADPVNRNDVNVSVVDADAAAEAVLSPDQIDRFWERVERTLKQVFGRADAGDVLDDFRRKLERSVMGTSVHVYHFDPLQIAADLAGHTGPIDATMRKAYRLVLKSEGFGDLPAGDDLGFAIPEDVHPSP